VSSPGDDAGSPESNPGSNAKFISNFWLTTGALAIITLLIPTLMTIDNDRHHSPDQLTPPVRGPAASTMAPPALPSSPRGTPNATLPQTSSPGLQEGPEAAAVLLKNIGNDRCLFLVADELLVQTKCDPTLTMRWELREHADGIYEIRSASNKNCVTVAKYPSGTGKADGDGVIHSPCRGAPDQRWRIAERRDGLYEIRNVNSDKCLAGVQNEEGLKQSEYTKVSQWTCRDVQLWMIVGGRVTGLD
jgi:hypothetical protein